MFIEFSGQEYHVLVSEKTAGVHVVNYQNGIIYLSAHHLIPQSELLLYLKIKQPQIRKAIKKLTFDRAMLTEIMLFNQNYGIKIDLQTKTPYIKDRIIYTSKLPINERGIDRLKTTIGRFTITEQIALWEERLDFLLDNIILKQLPSSLYIIHRSKQQMTFSKKLMESSIDLLRYVVATGVFDYLMLDNEHRERLFVRYINNWKHLERIIAYEAGQHHKNFVDISINVQNLDFHSL